MSRLFGKRSCQRAMTPHLIPAHRGKSFAQKRAQHYRLSIFTNSMNRSPGTNQARKRFRRMLIPYWEAAGFVFVSSRVSAFFASGANFSLEGIFR